MKIKLSLLSIFLLLIGTSLSFAVSSELEQGYNLFNNGEYQLAQENLEAVVVKDDKDLEAELNFWLGVISNKRQQYNKSVNYFEKALELEFDEEEIYYEYGQALYATQSWESAREKFLKSIDEDFMTTASMYYVAFISQSLEEWDMGINYYEKVIQDSDTSDRLVQSSKYQLTNILLEMNISKESEASFSRFIRLDILPKYIKSYYVDTESPLATEILQKISSIKKKYKVEPLKLENGRVIKDRAWNFRATEKISYDTNVVLEGDQFTPKATDKSSGVNTTSVLGKYRFIIKNKFLVRPEVKLSRTFYTERDNTEVTQNDTYNISGAVRSTFEHKYKDKPASSLFDLSYNYTARNYKTDNNLILYGRTLNFAIGERLKIFSENDSLFKLSYSLFTGHTKDLDSNTFGLLVTQSWKFTNNHRLIGIFSSRFKSVDKSSDSKNTFLVKGSYIIPEIFSKTLFSGSLGLSFIDTKEQSVSRGTEKNYTPSLSLSRRFYNIVDLKVSYDYILNSSKDKVNYDYDKHVVGLQAQINL